MRPCRSGRNLRRQGTDKTIARTRDVNWLNRPPRNSNDAIAIQSYCASPAKGDTNQTSELNYIRGELALRRLKFWKNEPFEPSPLRSGVWDMYKHVAEQSGLFDKSWYLRQYPEAVKPGLDPFEHYTNEGWKNGCSPGPLFDSPWYLDYYRDVAAAGLEPLGHYIFYGKAEGRKTNGASFALGKLVDSELHIPTTLSVSHLTPKHVLVIGSCFAYSVAYLVKETIPECECDYLLYNFVGQLPEPPPRAVSDYDFIVIMLPLRSVMPEYGYMRLPYGDMAAFSSFFESSVGRLEQLLNGALAYTRAHQKAAFVLNFLAPHGNYMGRLLPRRDLRNPSYFCSQLNIALEKMLEGQKSAHLIDLDALACSLGKRWINDDTLWVSSHGTFIDDWDPPQDARRLEQTTPIMQQFHFLTPPDFIGYIWREIVASYRIVRQADAIKLVVTDLDDTLWRGVAMDHEAVNTAIAIEGWPLGYIEALLIVKRRGLLLGVISKNDRANIEKLWPEICNGAIEISDFAVVKINWEPKAKNMEELLQEVNLLPHNVLFIDDNPVERAAMQAVFPDMRIIGGNPYEHRRLLLWAAETQVPMVTEESARRTEMVQAQVEREQTRKKMSREEFLSSLAVKMQLLQLKNADDPRFPRAFELLNKTNQFNTTGKRWTHEEMVKAMNAGARLYGFEVEDKYTRYGLVGVIIELHGILQQFVMSCRTVGLDVESAAIAELAKELRATGIETLSAVTIDTPSNLISRNIWQRSGFEQEGDGSWRASAANVITTPPHISITVTVLKSEISPVAPN